jgi:hypothetical protein
MGEGLDPFQDGGVRAEGITGFTFVAGTTGEAASCLFERRSLREGGGYLEKPPGPFWKEVLGLFDPFGLLEIVQIQFVEGNDMGASDPLSRMKVRKDGDGGAVTNKQGLKRSFRVVLPEITIDGDG